MATELYCTNMNTEHDNEVMKGMMDCVKSLSRSEEEQAIVFLILNTSILLRPQAKSL